MKLFSVILILLLIGCSVQKDKSDSNSTESRRENDTIHLSNENLEYDIKIIEPGFNSWLATQRPRGYYDLNYLEQRNRQMVLTYNQRVLNPSLFDPNLYPQHINYDYNLDYGYEVNFLLYNYLLYFQEKYRQKLR